ncbi:Nif11-like leader peptide family natural product precursor [Anaeroselena agilis]|uniref:Nif11-like leader peptide family natural product n=1 Tax=Anaeroselena agilis TaxID=3063788 RepID=A0ABU3P3Y0_9FIRM|nr:Nif11-like leader peptide family natural product precursor [Selenomonadales bacterium 4137-cl]MDT8902841.1 Nif11-like leader peptide family natural product precursor [Selenomonadales bacterium 4137-cl]
MSMEAATAFLKQARTDKAYSEQLKACKNVPQFLEQAAKAGFYFSQKELSDACGNVEEWIGIGAGVWGHSVVGKSECVEYK